MHYRKQVSLSQGVMVLEDKVDRTEMLQAPVNFAKADHAYMRLVSQIMGALKNWGGVERVMRPSQSVL